MQILATHVPNAVTLTPAAITFMKRMIRLSGLGLDAGFRLEVSPGGCSGLSASFSVEPAPGAEDVVLRFPEVTLFVPTACRPLLDGVAIDFEDSPTNTGFTFVDPKATGCGCSTTEAG